MWIDLAISVFLSTLRMIQESQDKKKEREKVKRPVLKVYSKIKEVYGDDPDFT